MFKIIIFSDSYQHFQESICEYEKRLHTNIEIIKLRPSKRKNISEIISEESILLRDKLEKIKGYKILLYIEWQKFSTRELYELIESKSQNFPNIVFIIGWAYGVNIWEINHFIDLKLSFSDMTFPHSMAYLLLLEQIYRISMMKKWTGYHH